MKRRDFQKIADNRLSEAEILLNNGYYNGAYYLAGYAIECAFKACIAKQIKKHTIPGKKFINDTFTHDFDRLANVAGLKVKLQDKIESSDQFEENWSIVKDWSVEDRYDISLERQRAMDIIAAIKNKETGILNWIKESW